MEQLDLEIIKSLPEEKLKKIALDALSEIPVEDLIAILELYSISIKAIRGESLKPGQTFQGLIDVQNIVERSRLPTRADILVQLYCRLLYKFYGEPCEPFKDLADELARDFIPYKGLNRVEAVEILKKAPEAQTQILYPMSIQPQELHQPKRGLRQRFGALFSKGKGEEEVFE